MTMRWAGFSGAPGYTNLHFLNPEPDPNDAARDALGTRVRAWFQTFSSSLPSGVTITFPTVLERFDTGTGVLEEELPLDPLTTVTGAGSGNYSSAVGACINWRTTSVLNGRRVRGRTFIVPLTAVAYAADGTLSDTLRTTFQTNANALLDPGITDLPLCIWAQPAPGGSDGTAHQVTTATVADKTAVLRSRRD